MAQLRHLHHKAPDIFHVMCYTRHMSDKSLSKHFLRQQITLYYEKYVHSFKKINKLFIGDLSVFFNII